MTRAEDPDFDTNAELSIAASHQWLRLSEDLMQFTPLEDAASRRGSPMTLPGALDEWPAATPERDALVQS
jgi:hypothetical protein